MAVELEDAGGLRVIITRQMRRYVSALIGSTIPQGQTGVRIQFLLLVPRIELRMTRVKRTTWRVLAGEGIIKLSNIKIQYHKKKKQYTVFTIVRYCRRSPRGL